MTRPVTELRRIAKIGGHAGVLVFFVTFLAFPFYWMLMTTFKTTIDLYDVNKNPFLFNQPPTLEHLEVLFRDTQYLQWLINTGAVGIAVVVITLAVNVPLNDQIKAAGTPDQIADLAAVREQFNEATWVRWNLVRAVASTIGFGCLAWALVLYGRT